MAPKRARHCSSIHCAWRDQIAVCSARAIRGPGRQAPFDRGYRRSLLECRFGLSHSLRLAPDRTLASAARTCEIGPDRVAWRRRARPPPPPPAGRVPDPALALRAAARACSGGSSARRREIDGQVLATDIHVDPEAGRTGAARTRSPGACRRTRRGPACAGRPPSSDGPPIPMARVRRVRAPGADRAARRAPLRPPSAPPPPRADARLLPRRRLGGRRPRHPRQRLPLPRRRTPASRCSRSTTGWRPSTPSRPRSRTR